tara:strand:+ start:143 stop:502 length:360 start_codon:yes stop_codon:yes gene_type:complete
MKNTRYNFKRNRFRSSNERSFKKNGKNLNYSNGLQNINDFPRKKINRNINTSKLIEKYVELAKEALSNGDKIMSENYFQHADHFIRVNEEKNLEKSEKNIYDNQKISNSDDKKSNILSE